MSENLHNMKTNNHSINDKLQQAVQHYDTALFKNKNYQKEHDAAVSKWQNTVLSQGLSAIMSKYPDFDVQTYETMSYINFQGVIYEPIDKKNASMSWTLSKNDINKLSKWIDSHYWLSYVPCFSEGIFHIKRTSYIHWILEDMNIKRNLIELKLNYFDKINHNIMLKYHIEVIVIFGTKSEDITILINDKKSMPCLDIMTLLNPHDITQWNTADIAQWKNIIQKIANDTKNMIHQGKNINTRNHYQHLTEKFLTFAAISNAAIACNPKYRINNKFNNKTSSLQTFKIPCISSNTSNSNLFQIGDLIIHSFTPNLEPIEWLNVKYRTPSYMVKKHIENMHLDTICFAPASDDYLNEKTNDDCPIPAASPDICIIGGT